MYNNNKYARFIQLVRSLSFRFPHLSMKTPSAGFKYVWYIEAKEQVSIHFYRLCGAKSGMNVYRAL